MSVNLLYEKDYNESYKDYIIDFILHETDSKLVNENIDLSNNKIHINIMMAIYLYGINSDRYHLTEYIFRHYKTIQNYFEKYAMITFTIIGSEKELSKNLVSKYFNFDNTTYFEFDQSDTKYKNIFNMLNNKINYGMKQCYNKHPDILLWAGSNDYICFNFFKQLIEFYNPNQLQIYGIDNYYNGNNAVYYCKFNNNKIEDIPFFWHNGKFNYSGRNIYNYVGGIFGVNKKVFDIYPDVLERWSCDEGRVEKNILDKNNLSPSSDKYVHKLNTKNLFFINFKIGGGQEISTYGWLYNVMKNDTIDNNSKYLNSHFLKIFQNEYKYFKSLIM
jgi:hypothetical protein